MVEKVHIYSDYTSFLKLLASKAFSEGRDLKSIICRRASVYLIVDEEEIQRDWNDVESPLRKGCDAFDIPCPQIVPEMKEIFGKPALCYQKDPYAIWFINTSEDNIQKFRELFGVWMINVDSIKDDTFYLHHRREYQKDDVIDGTTDNGWANYLEEVKRQKGLPPMNAIVINDRYLLNNTNENDAERIGFFGLHNLEKLLDALLPSNLRVPFQVFIFCQHPKLRPIITVTIINQFRESVRKLRDYPIVLEFVYGISQHKRTLFSNYFLFDVDRAYNAFYVHNYKKLNGENLFCLESYHNDPTCSGDTNYCIAKNKLRIIKNHCNDILQNPNEDILDYGKIRRADINGEEKIQNRLFP